MKTIKIDRTRIFLCLLFVLYVWDVAYFLGLRIVSQIPHPFLLFKNFGNVDSLRGLSAMLREVIFFFVSGTLVGIAIGMLVLYSSWLTQALRRFLRITLWFPLIIVFIVMAPFAMGVAAAALCSCYYYIAARSLLSLERHPALTYAARETLFQVLLFSLITQLWGKHWQWFIFTMFAKVQLGIEVFAALLVIVGLITWCFRGDFELNANRRASLITGELDPKEGCADSCDPVTWSHKFTLLIVGCLVGSLLAGVDSTAPYRLLGSEIWGDIRLSLLEVSGGVVLSGLAGQGVFVLLSKKAGVKKFLFYVLPLANISTIVLWLIIFTLWRIWFIPSHSSFIYFWHKVIGVGCLTFYPIVQTLWGLRNHKTIYRILMAIDQAVPIAFVAMVFGEYYAATQGLAFRMAVATAIQQKDQAIAVCVVTLILMVGLSVLLRWTARTVYSSVEMPKVVTN
jgi:ABC-type nitrate/sulfonate/bicarbonate transport system permease component